ncbi:hypothetical protein [Parabacteroides goldsteinii]|uniref:hypothetical protein n=1 Tax=Parabacteroides goldsteinii TaxID=328812 RepID=UPI0018971A75|nr:hypothetical protein [Parabacteroides goldsteinii]
MTKINQTNKQFTPNVKKLPLKEYYNSLPFAKKHVVVISKPREELALAIANACGKSLMTAKRWIYGYSKPCPAEKEKIAELLSSSVDNLFPQNKEVKA